MIDSIFSEQIEGWKAVFYLTLTANLFFGRFDMSSNNLRVLRMVLGGVSQRQVAKALGVSRDCILRFASTTCPVKCGHPSGECEPVVR